MRSIRPKLHRYFCKRLDARRSRGLVPIWVDLGFKRGQIIYARLKKDKGPGDCVLDIGKRGRGNNVIWSAVPVEGNWSKTYWYHTHIIRIYDGDTVTAADIDLGLRANFVTTLRLAGINTPELRGVSKAVKLKGLEARDRLMDLTLGKRIIVETVKDKTGKYGRYLATLFIGSTNVNNLLIREGLAEEY